MKLRHIGCTLMLIVSTPTLADSVCLSRATNQELLNEIARRMDSTGPGSQSVMVSATCSSWQLRLHLTSLDGNTGSGSLDFSNSTACSNFLTKFGANRTLSSNKIIGACSSWQLRRILIKTDATIQDLPSIDYSNATLCEEAAADLNR
jgi:hypothetical protein